MTENHLPDTRGPVETSPVIPSVVTQAVSAGASGSWSELKKSFLNRVQAEGFDDIPEPDSSTFPKFLAELNAKNPGLARELVQQTRSLRRGIDMPNSAASLRRQRKRETRRFLLMKQTPDGRWVLDKQKAPVYGMLSLLTVGGLLTAIYALPRLDGRGLVETKSPPPTRVQDPGVTPAPVTPDPGSEEALRQSREQLRQIRQERGMTTQTTTPKPNITLVPETTPEQGRGLTQVNTPPPPPAVSTSASSRNVYTPVTSTPTPARSVSFPTSTSPQISTRAYTPTPEPAALAPAPTPVVISAPERPVMTAISAPPTDIGETAMPSTPRHQAAPQKNATPSTPTRSVSSPPTSAKPQVKVTASAAPTVPKPSPSTSSRHPPPPTVYDTPSRTPGTMATQQTSTPQTDEPGIPFGGYAADLTPPPTDSAAGVSAAADQVQAEASANPGAYLTPTSTRAAYSGMVYQRKPQTQSAPVAAPSPATEPVQGSPTMATAQAVSPAAPTTGADTPFGSNVTNANSKIGATGPFKPLQQVSAALLTGIRTPNGGSVPVVAMTADGGSFVGVATVNATLARVDMQFRRFIAADGKIHEIDALAYAKEGTGGLMQGVPASVDAIAPTLALDMAQNSANSLNTYVQNLAAAATKTGNNTTINLGDGMTLSGPSVASLTQTLLGGLGSTFRMPENTQSIVRVATVKTNAQMVVIVGLGGSQ